MFGLPPRIDPSSLTALSTNLNIILSEQRILKTQIYDIQASVDLASTNSEILCSKIDLTTEAISRLDQHETALSDIATTLLTAAEVLGALKKGHDALSALITSS